MAHKRYRIVEQIDAGGMAEVFLADAFGLDGLHKRVAIKRVLPALTAEPRFVRMFLDEAKVSLRLSHHNIVQVFDVGMDGGAYFIVMEYIEGLNLRAMMAWMGRRSRRLPVGLALHIALGLCQGLHHAHSRRDEGGRPLGIVHRDISPANVLLSVDGEVKIVDFGLAKAQIQRERTEPGVVKGKLGYLSPEAARGEEVTAQSDLFATAVVLWEMLAHQRLFSAATDYETLELVRHAHVPAIREWRPDVSEGVASLLREALDGDPARRPPTARALAEAIAQAMGPVQAMPWDFVLGDMVRDALGEAIKAPASPASSLSRDAFSALPRMGALVREPLTPGATEDVASLPALEPSQVLSLEEISDIERFMATCFPAQPPPKPNPSTLGPAAPYVRERMRTEQLALEEVEVVDPEAPPRPPPPLPVARPAAAPAPQPVDLRGDRGQRGGGRTLAVMSAMVGIAIWWALRWL